MQGVIDTFVMERSSPIPLYFQVAQHLESAIADGTLAAGTLLLNEVDMADALALSRPTMRRALQSLVDKGLLVRRRGVGTRVVQSKMRRSLELTSLFEDLSKIGQAPTTLVLSSETVQAPPDVAAKMRLAPDSDVVELVRLRSAGGKPIAKMTNFVPVDMVRLTSDDLAQRGLYDLMRSQGVTLHSADQTIGAATASAADAKLLEEPRGAALLTMERVAYDDRGRVVEYGRHLYAASRYSFEISLLTG
jgi:GntR family transcriptional regulator